MADNKYVAAVHAYNKREADKYFPAPPAPPSENLDRFQWYNPADWFGMHEEDEYQQQEKKYKEGLQDLSERRNPVHGRVYVVPHEAEVNREQGDMQYYVYHAPNRLTKEEQARFPKGKYVPLWVDERQGTAGITKNHEEYSIPHTTDDKGIPNSVRVRGGGVKDFIEPYRDVIPTPTKNPTEHLHNYRDLQWKDNFESQEIRRQPFKDWLRVPVNSGAFNQYMGSINPMV